jgi:aldehyde dehydrogenase (NAD+)
MKTGINKESKIEKLLASLGLGKTNPAWSTGQQFAKVRNGKSQQVFSPVNGKLLASVEFADAKDYEQIVRQAQIAFATWQKTPAPKRGEIVRQTGDMGNRKDFTGRLR